MRLHFRRYRRPFVRPFTTAHGTWSEREGIIVRLEAGSADAGGTAGAGLGYGEVAPLEAFQTETVEAASAFLRSLGSWIDLEDLDRVPAELPCTAFGLRCAWRMAHGRSVASTGNGKSTADAIPLAALLPAGERALTAFEEARADGFTTFKYKAGTLPEAYDHAICGSLLSRMAPGQKLRIDANGSLDNDAAKRWLAYLDNDPAHELVDFLEQPLPPDQLDEMLALQNAFRTPIALDESVTQSGGIRSIVERRFKGPLVIKPSIAGDPVVTLSCLRQVKNTLVFSSAFETAVGMAAVAAIACEAGSPAVAAGLGTGIFFPHNDGFGLCMAEKSRISRDDINATEPGTVWINCTA